MIDYAQKTGPTGLLSALGQLLELFTFETASDPRAIWMAEFVRSHLSAPFVDMIVKFAHGQVRSIKCCLTATLPTFQYLLSQIS